jgi:CRP/FNR family cyclic AMP-dependent transcriptional regulator
MAGDAMQDPSSRVNGGSGPGATVPLHRHPSGRIGAERTIIPRRGASGAFQRERLRSRVFVLDADPGLLDGMDPRIAPLARRAMVARVESVRTGHWTPPHEPEDHTAVFAYLVLDGLICRHTIVGETTSVELLGPGDVLRPGTHETFSQADAQIRWSVLRHTELACLDEEFARLAARWPSVFLALLARMSERADGLSMQVAISHVTGVEKRVLMAFNHLADRWGRVTPHGILVPLRLTTAMIGQIIGARRPSVSAAIGDLTRQGLVERCPDGTWLLHPETATQAHFSSPDDEEPAVVGL